MSSRDALVGIIQARMGSTRLPGKVLADLAGRPLLERLVQRVTTSRLVESWIIATTDRDEDAAIEALARSLGVAWFRGSEHDVLDRYYQAAKRAEADVVVRLTADNPVVDGAFVDECVTEFLQASCDYLDTMTSATYPYGLSVEVFRMTALDDAWRHEVSPSGREHVTSFIRTRPEYVKLHKACSQNDGDLRWTVDTAADLAHVRALFNCFRLDREQPGHDELARQARLTVPHQQSDRTGGVS